MPQSFNRTAAAVVLAALTLSKSRAQKRIRQSANRARKLNKSREYKKPRTFTKFVEGLSTLHPQDTQLTTNKKRQFLNFAMETEYGHRLTNRAKKKFRRYLRHRGEL